MSEKTQDEIKKEQMKDAEHAAELAKDVANHKQGEADKAKSDAEKAQEHSRATAKESESK
jgi:hypothetical protein